LEIQYCHKVKGINLDNEIHGINLYLLEEWD